MYRINGGPTASCQGSSPANLWCPWVFREVCFHLSISLLSELLNFTTYITYNHMYPGDIWLYDLYQATKWMVLRFFFNVLRSDVWCSGETGETRLATFHGSVGYAQTALPRGNLERKTWIQNEPEVICIYANIYIYTYIHTYMYMYMCVHVYM